MNTNSRITPGRASGTSSEQLLASGGRSKAGPSRIEAEHQAIFAVAMEIAQCWKARGDIDRLRRLSEKLELVLAVHFRHEEQQLAAQGSPQLEEHKAGHKALLGELHVMRRRLGTLDDSDEGGPGFMLHNFVMGVAATHCPHGDRVDCAIERQQAARTGQSPPATPLARKPLSAG